MESDLAVLAAAAAISEINTHAKRHTQDRILTPGIRRVKKEIRTIFSP